MLKERIASVYEKGRKTILGVGPMSRACVDASLELAQEHQVPLLLIASRRQVDAKSLGGGYVEQWSTEAFAQYVRQLDPDGAHLILCRDHGGAYQGTGEEGLSLAEATKRAKESYATDIAAGFGVLHIDPSLDPTGHARPDQIMDRAFELISFCWEEAQRLKRDIVFEVGTEEQTPFVHEPAEIEANLTVVQNFCRKERIPTPLFMVAQTGTKVMETRNIGVFEEALLANSNAPDSPHLRLPSVIETLNRHGTYLKQHNTDYLANSSLSKLSSLGVHAANVAPEFGVLETRAILQTLEANGLADMAAKFVETAVQSGKWKKWMISDSAATDRDRAEICGHYVFASSAGKPLLQAAEEALQVKGINLGVLRHDAVKAGIARYLKSFGW